MVMRWLMPCPPVKEVAYQVIDSNENDGVILKIKEILKGKC